MALSSVIDIRSITNFFVRCCLGATGQQQYTSLSHDTENETLLVMVRTGAKVLVRILLCASPPSLTHYPNLAMVAPNS
jgi:hypothetical protein